MTREEKLTLMKCRYDKLKASPKNAKSGGVLKKLARQIRKLENAE